MLIKRDKLDKVFSDLVRCRANWCCELCGKAYPDKSSRMGLHCSHHFGRRYQSVRYDPDNAMSLCMGCHRRVEEDPELHVRLFKDALGEDGYATLISKKNSIRKWLKGEKDEGYRCYLKQFKQMSSQRDKGDRMRIEFEMF